jgi:hypothetical protein
MGEHRQGLVIEDATGRNVAVTYEGKDAALVAAAPDLLEALKAMCEEWRHHGCCDSREVVYRAERAIEKVSA